MKSKYTRPLIILVTIITIAICYIGFNEPIFMDSQEMRHPSVLLGSFGQTGYYKINPETILEALESGERNVFTPLVVTPIAPDYSTPFHWEQTDYITISNALQEFVWQENSANWSIHSMTFYGDCNYNPVGFDIINITYYKETGLQRYDARMIGIYPLISMVAWGAGENYPRSFFENREYIDLEALALTADNALVLAEEGGGRASRLIVANTCRISASISSNTQTWTVIYTDNSTYPIFELTIDPYSGMYEVPESRQ